MIYRNYLKRTFDVAAATMGLATLSLPITFVCAAKLVYHRENPFFMPERIGKDGKPFKMIKLKSMKRIYDDKGKLLPDDQRVTGFGRFIRHTALDEMPQLWNILKGDMSFVGPRPRNEEEFRKIALIHDRQVIQSVRPGLTGLWQITSIGRKKRLPKHQRAGLDARYVRDGITFAKDMKILWKTPKAIALGHDGTSLKP